MPVARSSDTQDIASEDMLARRARQLTRIHEMFWNVSDVINLGKQLHKMNEDDELAFREGANDRKKRAIVLADRLNELEPTLFERLCRPGANANAATRDAKTRLSNGQSNGKSEDMRKIRKGMPKLIEWKTPLGDKSTQGLQHRECAFLLSSPDLDFEDEEAALKFMAYEDPPMTPSTWPRFFWEEGKYNPDQIQIGLLRSEIMIKVAQSILISPMTAESPNTIQASGARGYHRRGAIGLANTYQLREVTTAFISYVAVVTRDALTSTETFSETCGGFNYVEFYTQVREFLDAPKFAHWTADLLQHWNSRVFEGITFHTTGTPSSGRANGTLARLEAQLEGAQIPSRVPCDAPA